ncbi:unnamed protein product [Ectocarpus sp. 12 AP-2014]
MASTGKIRPGTSASLGAAVVVEPGGKGKGVAAEEMWLNGPFNAPVPPGPLDILFVDEEIVVCNKPSDLLCVPGRIEKDSLATRAALELGHYRVDRMIVHRLDMATSGCVIMARTDAALKDLNRQFRERQVRKRYVAMVHGVLWADEGEVDLPLCRNRGCPPLHMVNFEHGKPSLTKWRVLERAADRTRVELIPVSGRSHQLVIQSWATTSTAPRTLSLSRTGACCTRTLCAFDTRKRGREQCLLLLANFELWSFSVTCSPTVPLLCRVF